MQKLADRSTAFKSFLFKRIQTCRLMNQSREQNKGNLILLFKWIVNNLEFSRVLSYAVIPYHSNSTIKKISLKFPYQVKTVYILTFLIPGIRQV